MNMDLGSIPNHFDRSKPFYPLVMNYIIQLIGFKELSVRHLIDRSTFADSIIRCAQNKNPNASKENVEELEKAVNKLLGPLSLKSECITANIEVDIEEIAKELIDNSLYLSSFFMKSAGNLLVLAYEYCKGKPFHNKDPLWEFLRHCRNAAAHGGYFNLAHGEPQRPAQWGRMKIERYLQGTALFKDGTGNGFLSPGDPIHLLWDIERTYIR
jgi:hypothetical protein